MKRRIRQLLALLLASGMLVTQLPMSPVAVQAEETSTETETGSEETGLTDDTVVATTDWNYANEHSDYCAYFYGETPLYQYVLTSLGLPSDTAQLTYGQVKEITTFIIPSEAEEDSSYSSISLLGMNKLLPNLEKFVTNQNVYGWEYIGAKVKDITINASDSRFDITELNDIFGQIENLTINAGSIYVNDHWDSDSSSYVYDTISSAPIKKLSLNGRTSTEVQDWIAGLEQLEELHLTNAHACKEQVDKYVSLKNLTVLDLSNNSSLQSIPDTVTELTNLTSLNLSGCGLNNIPDLSKMDSLTSLNLMNNENLIRVDVMKKVPEKFATDADWAKENFEPQNEVVTTGTNQSDYYIPDQTLYAELLENADQNKDGILTVAEAWGTSFLDLRSQDLNDVKDFTGLGTVFKNLTWLSIYKSFANADEEKSAAAELMKMKNLNYLDISAISQSTFDTICDNLTDLTGIKVYTSEEKGLDITGISKLSKLTSVDLYCNIAEGYTALNQLEQLNSLSLNADKGTLSDIQTALSRLTNLHLNYSAAVDEQDSVIFENLTNLNSLNIDIASRPSGDFELQTLNLEKLDQLTSLSVYGRVKEVILPEKADNMSSLTLSGYSNATSRGTMDNLDSLKNLSYLSIYGYEVKDFGEIAKLTQLYTLDLDNCGLEDTEGLGDLENLHSLTIANNDQLTTIAPDITKLTSLDRVYINDNDELTTVPDFLGNNENLSYIQIQGNWKLADIGTSISKLTQVYNLDLSCNALETLPDLSALCNENGLLYHSDNDNLDETSVYANRLQLYGNKLSKDTIKAAGLSDEFIKDENWMIKSTSRRYRDNSYSDLYYPDLTEAFILHELETNYTNSFTTDKDMTISAETIQYIQDKQKYCYISLISGEDAKLRTEYDIYYSNIENSKWDGQSGLELKAPKEDSIDVADYAKYFAGVTPLVGYVRSAVPDFVYESTQILGLAPGNYWIYHLNTSTGDMSLWTTTTINENAQWIYLGGTNDSNDIYFITPAGTYNNHNVSGVSSGMTVADKTGRTPVVQEKKLSENSWTYELTDAFKQLVEDAKDGDTLNVYVDDF